jgi:hypothetical protein
VYIIPGSSESGAVPKTTFRVPPDFPVALELVLVLDELPQAATARAAPSTATAAGAVLNSLIEFLLLEV